MSHRKTEMSLIVALRQFLPAALNCRHKGAKQRFSRIKVGLQFYNLRPPYRDLTAYPGPVTFTPITGQVVCYEAGVESGVVLEKVPSEGS